ncbi:MAG: glycosyltransferase family 2 protein [Patescibacteria group bacterium]|jgi:hypothetical protein
MNSTPKIAVILVNWNGQTYLPDCLRSLAVTKYPADRWQIVMIDNHSTDASVLFAKSEFPNVVVIENSTNLGFSAANNQGIRWALEHGFEVVVLLNYDTTVAPDWLMELAIQSQSDPKIGAVQAKILLHDHPEQINTVGNKLQYLGFGYSGNYLEVDSPAFDQPKEIAYPSGAAFLLTKAAVERVGVLDEDLFMYHEDLDLGWRLWLAGFKVTNAPKSRVFHKYNFSRNPKKFYYMERNRFIVLAKNYSIKTLLLILLPLIIMELGMLGYAAVTGWLGYKLKSYFDALVALPHTLKKRRGIQSTRRVTDREFVHLLSTGVVFGEINNPLLRWIVNPLLTVYWFCIRRLL